MNLHRLRVINFDRCSSEEKAARQNPSIVDHKNVLNDNKPSDDYYAIRSHTSGECGDGTESSEKRKTVFSQKLNSNTFKRNKSKKYLRRNASLALLKRKKILTNKKNYSSIFPHNFEGSLKSSFRRVKRKKYIKKTQYENLEPDNEIQVLYTNNTFKTPKASRCVNKSRISRKRSKCLYDIFHLQKNNRLFAYQCNYNKSSNKYFGQKKRVHWKTSNKPYTCVRKCLRSKNEKSSPLKNIRSAKSSRFNAPIHSTVNLSDPIVLKFNKRSPIEIHRNEISQNKLLCNNQQVSVTPSYLQTYVKCLTDAAATTSHFFNINSTSKTNNSIQENRNRVNEKNLEFNTTPNNYLIDIITKTLPTATTFSKKCVICGKSIVKYILFVVIFIAWVPCIILILTCWSLTYPLRPHFTQTDNLPNTQGFCNTCNSWRAYVNRILNFITVMVHKVFYLSKYVLSPIINRKYGNQMFHRQTPQKSSYNCHSKQEHPNPTRKYTLRYAKSRGWVIKPIPRQLEDKRTNIFQALQHLFRQDSKENYKNLSKKPILRNHGFNKECRCLYGTKKVTIQTPTDKIENTPHSPRIESHTKYTQAQNPQLTRGTQHNPLKTINKSSEYHHRSHNNRLLSYHHSCTPNSPLEKQLTTISAPLQNTYIPNHDQQTLTLNKPPQNCFQQSDHLPSVDVKTMLCLPTESQKRHHKVHLHSSRMPQPLSPSITPLSGKFVTSPRRYLPNKQCRPSEVPNRHNCDSVHIRDKCSPTKIISISKSTLNKNTEPCLRCFINTYVNNRKKYKKSSKGKKKISCFCKRYIRKLSAITADVDTQVWRGDAQCKLYDLRSKKDTCLSKLYKFIKNVFRLILYLISSCIWCPIFCCLYICCELVCKCTTY